MDESSDNRVSEEGSGHEEEVFHDVPESVGDLDNRYVSEDTVVKEGKVELTEEQVKELKTQAGIQKDKGNEHFKSGDYADAISSYSEALKLFPLSCKEEIATCYANRAACYMKMDQHQEVIDDCTKALEMNPEYVKALLRRAHSYEATEKFEEALQDYKKVLELDPSQPAARNAAMYLPEKIKQQHEKLKEEMLGKLRELGDAVLKPFGLSTTNFQFQQDPNTGGYSINFKR